MKTIASTSLEKLVLTQKMMKISRQGWQYGRSKLQHPALSNVMYNIIVVIYSNPDISQDGISKALKRDKSSVAKIVSKKKKKGLVVRNVNPDDRREYRLQLSEEGQEVVKELLDTLREWQDKALKGVSEHDKKVFIKVLDMIEIKAAELDQQ